MGSVRTLGTPFLEREEMGRLAAVYRCQCPCKMGMITVA